MRGLSGITAAMLKAINWAVVFCIFGVVLFVVVCWRSTLAWPSLDKAQAKFEATDSRGYNWPWYHQKKAGMDLRCSDTADGSLRFCTVVLPYVHPETLEPLGVSFDTFACSKTTCGWVQSGPVDINP